MTQVQFRSIYFKVFLPSSGRKQASAVSEGDWKTAEYIAMLKSAFTLKNQYYSWLLLQSVSNTELTIPVTTYTQGQS